ncbi:MAG: DUF5050 domain-containing protein [Planctomycetes bacterium]|nr:DUF5050 domain-containing protein [Planctomycetota bacterium]
MYASRFVGFVSGLGLSVFVLFVHPSETSAQSIYWTDKDAPRIQRANRDGTDLVDLVIPSFGLDDPRGIALDVAGGKMYWADNGTNTIQRADLDGSNRQTLESGLQFPADVTLDLDGGKVYWVDRNAGRIQRKNLDGSGAAEDVVTGITQPYYLALDLESDLVYWSEFGGNGVNSSISRASLDGNGSPEILVSGLERPRGVALDLEGGMIYWAERGSAPAIKRFNLDGTGTPQTLFNAADGLVRPHGIALDVEADLIYWTDTTTRSIHRGAMDGNDTAGVLISGLVGPWDLALTFSPRGPLSDLTGNGFVDFEDLTVLLAGWNKPGTTAADGNLVDPENTPINFEDLTVLLAEWTGPGPAGAPEAALAAVPEPHTLGLAMVGLISLVCSRRSRRR